MSSLQLPTLPSATVLVVLRRLSFCRFLTSYESF